MLEQKKLPILEALAAFGIGGIFTAACMAGLAYLMANQSLAQSTAWPMVSAIVCAGSFCSGWLMAFFYHSRGLICGAVQGGLFVLLLLGFGLSVEKALAAVQSLEPAGVGARNLSECLVLQLQRRHEDSELAIRIARDYLDPLSKSRYGLIAKSLGVCQEEVRTACDLIRTLNPRPGGGFAARENLVYINPDLFVVNFPDHFELLTNDYFFPDLNISGYYCRMLKSTEDNEVKDYLMGKVRQAKWVVHSIEQRRSTLLRCAECILELQEEFFRHLC